MIVWASKDGQFGFAKATFGKDKSITIKLDYNEQNMPKEADLDIVPPASNTTLPAVTKAQRDENTRRLTYEDSIRHAYIATFPTAESMKDYRYSAATPYIIKARGNWKTIKAFVEKYANQQKRALQLLSTLSDKDLRDMPMYILEDNMKAKSSQTLSTC